MSYVIGSIRLFYLTQQKNDLEHKIMLIAEAKADMSKSITELIGVGTDLDSDNPIIKDMKARRDKLEKMSQELEAKMELYKTKLEAVKNEINEAKGMVKDGAQSEFKYGL